MIQNAIAMVGSALLVGCTVQFARQLARTERMKWLPLVSLLICLVPAGQLSIGQWIHSFTGFLSTPLLVLVAWYVASPIIAQTTAQQMRFHQIQLSYWRLMLIIGSFYFPMALGLGGFDPHSLGWQTEFVWIPTAISIAMLMIGEYLLASLIFTSMLAWQCNILGSTNGWSYLIDPIAFGFSAAGLVASGISKLWNKDRMIFHSEKIVLASRNKAA